MLCKKVKTKLFFKRLDIIFITVLIVIFFAYYLNKISYGLPFFLNPDEIAFQGSTLSSLGFLTGYFEFNYNPLYAPLVNLILILKFIFINEFLINSISLDQIKLKIYFNPELFLFYGRLASLTITSLSIFFLYLIFKKLKINFLIYSTLLITFVSSLVILNISTTMGKNSCNLLIYLIQLYFLIKYLLKIEKFDYKSYFVFGLLASFAWGVNYWPAFISIYAVFFLHFRKFKFAKIHYLTIFISIFIIFGPFINIFFVDMGPLEHISHSKNLEAVEKVEIGFFIKYFLNNVITSFKIVYFTDKNILLLILVMPIFLINKYTHFKKEFLIIFFLIIEPILLFGVSGSLVPQLRYFAGIICVILILTALVFNELNKTSFRYLGLLLLICNFYFIYSNVKKNNEINNILSKNHSFFNFNKNIRGEGIDRSKVLYLVDLNFQESLKQNLNYIKLYENNSIKNSENSKKIYENIKNKVKIIENTNKIIINNRYLKDDITYFNYTYFEINDLNLFFESIKEDFKYVVIEESTPFYLSNPSLQSKIKSFVKENFILNYTQFKENKIFLRSQQTVIHYFANTLSRFDYDENINNDKLEVVYGTNYSLYKLK